MAEDGEILAHWRLILSHIPALTRDFAANLDAERQTAVG
jgi:hypothetical protein